MRLNERIGTLRSTKEREKENAVTGGVCVVREEVLVCSGTRAGGKERREDESRRQLNYIYRRDIRVYFSVLRLALRLGSFFFIEVTTEGRTDGSKAPTGS